MRETMTAAWISATRMERLTFSVGRYGMLYSMQSYELERISRDSIQFN